MTTIKTTVSAVAMSLMVLSGVSVTGVFLSAEAAFAKSDRANSKSSSSSRGKSSSSSSNRDKSSSSSSSRDKSSERNSKGKTASSLGALNAGHASDTAKANAAANSRVGLVAAFEAAAGLTDAKQEEFNAFVEANPAIAAAYDACVAAEVD
ncbi:MAG TPA: hypothetical protein VLA51_07560, partial [Paracoccaceae bacterium]|nr:hypothetical protein [Paracoccaceae bacterium]